jgi:hypothetical protein
VRVAPSQDALRPFPLLLREHSLAELSTA